MKILVILAHPDLSTSRLNRRLHDAIKDIDHITVNNIYQSYPDWQIDVQREQDLLSQHDRVIFQFPLYWYSTPPLLKKW